MGLLGSRAGLKTPISCSYRRLSANACSSKGFLQEEKRGNVGQTRKKKRYSGRNQDRANVSIPLEMERQQHPPGIGVHGVPFFGGFLGQIADLDGFALSFELVAQMRQEVQISGSGAFGFARLAFLALALGILGTTHF